MNTTDAMDRLASADPFPDGLPTPPFEPVLRRLDEQEPSATAARRAARGFSSRRWEPGWVLPAISLLVVGVVLAAVALLVHRGAQSPPAAGRARSQSLLSQFGILRRPQTPRDSRLPRIVKNMLGVAPQRHDLLPSLTRVVGEFPSRGEGRVLFVVIAHGARPSHPREIWLMMVTSAPDGAGGGGASPFTPGELFPQIGDGYASELVPDAVTRVKWVFGGRTVYPAIRDNVAVAPASVPRGTGPGLKSVTWYDAGGRVVAYEDAATFQKRQAASEQRSIDREINPVLLRRFPVLNRPHTTADRLPSALQTITRRDRSLAPWLSQRVDIPGSRLVDWIVPGRDGYCRFDAERLPGGRTRHASAQRTLRLGLKPDHKGDRTHHQRRVACPGSEPKQRTNAGDRVLAHNRHIGHGRPLRRPQCPSPDYRRHDRRPCFPWRPDLSPHPRPTTPRTKDPNANALKPRAWNSPPVLDVYPSRVVPSTLLEARLGAFGRLRMQCWTAALAELVDLRRSPRTGVSCLPTQLRLRDPEASLPRRALRCSRPRRDKSEIGVTAGRAAG